MKELITHIVYWLATPFRKATRRKYSDNEPDIVHHREFPNESYLPIISKYVAAGEKVVFVVKGYSMRPFLEHLRDKVELSPWTQLHVGDAVLAEVSSGHYVLHRIMSMEGEQLTLHGDGNLQGVEYCTLQDVRGVVTKYIRPGGHVLLSDDTRLKRRIRLWNKLPLLIRRVFLFIYRQTI